MLPGPNLKPLGSWLNLWPLVSFLPPLVLDAGARRDLRLRIASMRLLPEKGARNSNQKTWSIWVRSNRRCAAADVLALDGLSWCRLGVDAAGAGLGDAVDAHSVAAMPPLGTVSMKSGASLTLWANANYVAISNFFLTCAAMLRAAA